MNKEQQELLDEAYENYSKEYEKDNSVGMCLLVSRMDGKSTYRKPNKEMFVDLCQHDKTFSEKWRLEIEEKELSLDERYKLAGIFGKEKLPGEPYYTDEQQHSLLDELVPTRAITITYNDKTIESYE